MANISHHFENKKDSNNMNSADADGILSPTTTNRCYESLETIQPFSSEVIEKFHM